MPQVDGRGRPWRDHRQVVNGGLWRVSDDPGNSFLREFTRPVIDLRRRPIAERVTWMRRRLDAAWG